ncbi:DUF2183 domain-containing protein [Oligoflexaceae bacterium]|nr:DUF2183 domain-containing protein [Oligoflexaceae bacterium]
MFRFFICLLLVGCGHNVDSALKSQSSKAPWVVISDIDDTIRLSGGDDTWVKVRYATRTNEMTFFGFNEIYRELMKNPYGTTMHYVTASAKTPVINLFKIVKRSVQNGGFPEGEFTGRPMFKDTYEYKMQEHKRIIQRFPDARILLLGDNTSFDEKIFVDLKEKYPEREIEHLVHHVTDQPKFDFGSRSYVAAPDLALQLSNIGFLSKKSADSILSSWLSAYEDETLREERIFPKWMNCDGFSGDWSEIGRELPLSASLRLYQKRLQQHCP